MSYIVAFRYTKATGGYHGIVTWTSFDSKEEFEKWYTPDIREREEVVEEGTTDDRAIELTNQTPLACRIAACAQDATDEDGQINQAILDFKIRSVLVGECFSRFKL